MAQTSRSRSGWDRELSQVREQARVAQTALTNLTVTIGTLQALERERGSQGGQTTRRRSARKGSVATMPKKGHGAKAKEAA